MPFKTPDNFQPYTASAEEARSMRSLTPAEAEELGIGKKKKEKPADAAVSLIETQWLNPETKAEQEIQIDIQKEIDFFQRFYETNLGLQIDRDEIQTIWNQNCAELKKEIETYGYDTILIILDNLPEEESLNQKLIETMEETVGGKKKKVEATFQSDNFQSGGSFAKVRNSYSPGYRLVLTHSVSNIEDHPILKAMQSMDVMQVTGLGADEVSRRITNNEELPVDCKLEINGQEIEIKAEGESLEEYMILQRMHFAKTGKFLDTKGSSYARLLKSRSGSRVVGASWSPVGRQLAVYADDPGDALAGLGLRLSRSFQKLA
jgi:hypothetical protein